MRQRSSRKDWNEVKPCSKSAVAKPDAHIGKIYNRAYYNSIGK